MQNPSLTMGLEVEMHGIWFTFMDTAQDDHFWPHPPGGTEAEDTMMGRNPILVPESLANNAASQYTDQLNWQANWGFLVGGDDFQTHNGTYIAGGGNDATDYCRCCFELASPANVISDARYWYISRRAMQLFRDAMYDFRGDANAPPTNHGVELFKNFKSHPVNPNQTPDIWYPIDDLIDHYNDKIDNYLTSIGVGVHDPERSRWRLKKSYDLEQFENLVGGNHLGNVGNWRGYFTVPYEADPTTAVEAYRIWCDSQVNYEVDLEFLYDHLDEWLAVWEHMWLFNSKVGGVRVSSDPDLGHKKLFGFKYVVRNHFNVALWRAAKVKANQFVNGLLTVLLLNPLANEPQIIRQLKSLVMMLFAVGSIRQEDGGPTNTGVNKNSYSQFPKTSPASIVGKFWSAAKRTTVRRMASHTPLATLGDVSIPSRAAAIVLNMRQVDNLRPYLASKPHSVKVPGVDSSQLKYKRQADATITGALTAQEFKQIWRGAFSDTALDAGNHFGYTRAAPFYCYWALAHTAMPAVREHGSRKIKVLFESRFGHNMLNMGFNPDTTEETFYHSYRSILMLTAPDPAERVNFLGIIKGLSNSTSKTRSKFRKKMEKGQKRGVH